MRSRQRRMAGGVHSTIALFCCAMIATPLFAQKKGNNAVYNGTTSVTGSAAFIDATPYASTSTTICEVLYNIMNGTSVAYPTPGAVIDARGLNTTNSYSSGSSLACLASESPWQSGSTYLSVPARILLPAGKIIILYPWVLPDYTKIVGEGSSPTSGAAGATTIQASTSFSGSAMIQMGSSTCGVCFEISMTDVTLDAQGQSIDGVDNSNAEELSSLQRVAILNSAGNGLYLSSQTMASNGTATHSGPYVDLYIAAGTTTSSTTSCVRILDAQPRGIHGLTCSASSTTSPKAGIYLDGGNVSLENIAVSGFTDGILIGAQSPILDLSPVQLEDIYANVLSNVSGTANLTNLVHICNPGNVIGNCSSAGFSGTEDIAMASLTGGSGINTVRDDLTGAIVTDSIVALYDLGEPIQANGSNLSSSYSRFTTSPSDPVPTWLVGTAVNPTNASCSTVANGSLYSRGVTGGSGGTLWGCVGGKWILIK